MGPCVLGLKSSAGADGAKEANNNSFFFFFGGGLGFRDFWFWGLGFIGFRVLGFRV